MILASLLSTGKVAFEAFDTAGAHNAMQLGVNAPFHHPKEAIVHFRFVHSLQIHPLGRKYAAR